jgi:hypothetical protein
MIGRVDPSAAAWATLVVIVTVVAFLPWLDNGFTNWDDPQYVTDNVPQRDRVEAARGVISVLQRADLELQSGHARGPFGGRPLVLDPVGLEADQVVEHRPRRKRLDVLDGLDTLERHVPPLPSRTSTRTTSRTS